MAKSPNKPTTITRKPRTKTEPQAVEAKRTMFAGASAASDGSVEERIRQRAYELFEQEGRQEGRDEEYWLRAEAEIRGRKSA